jgi:lysophospholipase L1-like esterase
MRPLGPGIRALFLAAAALAAAGCGGGSSDTTSSSATPANFDFGNNDPRKVTAFGDSITAGVLEEKRRDLGLSTSNNYPNLLQAKLRALDPAWRVVNRGVPGERVAAGLARLPFILTLDRSGFVLIMEGINDADACGDPSTVASTLRSMVGIVKANHAIPILGTLTPVFRNDPCAQDVVSRVNALLPGIAAAEHIVLANIFNGMNDRSLFGLAPDRDPLHPNERGYAVMADIWYQAMLQALPGGVTTALRKRP